MPGMPMTADVKVGKRTLVSYLFARVLPVFEQRDARALITARAGLLGMAWVACARELGGVAASRLRQALERADEGQLAEVFPILAKAAERGDSEAQFRVGKAYLDGKGVPPSRAHGGDLARAGGRGGKGRGAMRPGLAVSDRRQQAVRRRGGAPAACSPTCRARSPTSSRRSALGQARPPKRGPAEAQALLGYVFTSGPEHLRDLAGGR